MLPLFQAGAAMLSGGGGLGGMLTGEEGGPVTSTATSGGTMTTGAGAMTIGGGAGTNTLPWALIAGAIVLAAVILKRL